MEASLFCSPSNASNAEEHACRQADFTTELLNEQSGMSNYNHKTALGSGIALSVRISLEDLDKVIKLPGKQATPTSIPATSPRLCLPPHPLA